MWGREMNLFIFLQIAEGRGEKQTRREVRKRGFLTKAFCKHKTIILCWTLQHLAPCVRLQNTRGNTIVDEPLQLQLHGGEVCSLHFRIRVSLWLKSQKPFFAMNVHLLVLNHKTHSLPRIYTCLLSPAQTSYTKRATSYLPWTCDTVADANWLWDLPCHYLISVVTKVQSFSMTHLQGMIQQLLEF